MATAKTPMELFVGLSGVLTGIDTQKLAPPLDPVNIKQTYFDTANTNAGSDFNQLLQIYDANQTSDPATIANIVFNQSGPAIKYLARTVMLMWYLGAWYAPQDLQAYNSPTPPPQPINSTVISADAYTQGWSWRVAQAHPMGFSTFTFGYWSQDPPSLADFVGTGGQS